MSLFRKHSKLFSLFIFIFILCLTSASAFAAEKSTTQMLNEGIGISGFDNILSTMGLELVYNARIIVGILIAASGIMVAFGIDDGKKTMWSAILGIGLALNLGSFLYSSLGHYWEASTASQNVGRIEIPVIQNEKINKQSTSQEAQQEAKDMATNPSTKYEDMMTPKSGNSADGAGFHLFRSFISQYVERVIEPGASNLKGILIKLSLAITLIDASLKLSLDLVGGNVVKFLISLALKVGFNIFLIDNWITSSFDGNIKLTQSLCNGFAELGFKAAGKNITVDNLVFAGLADGIIKSAYLAFNAFYAGASDIGFLTHTFLCLFATFSLICFFLGMVWLAFEMIMAQIEFYTMALLTMMLLPFMMSDHTSFLSRNAISAMFNCAMKVSVIAFLGAAGTSAVGRFFDSASGSFANVQNDNLLSLLLQINMTVFLILFLVIQIPKLIQGLLSGSPSMGASDLVGVAKQGVTLAATAAGVGAGLASVGLNAGAGKMSSLGNLAGGTGDMLKGAYNMAMGNSDAASSNFSSGMSKYGTAVTEAGQGIKDMGKAASQMGINALQTSSPIKSFQGGVNKALNPYNFSDSDVDNNADHRSWFTGKALTAEGNVVRYSSGGMSGSGGGGAGGSAANANDDGVITAEHDRKVNNQVHVSHDRNIDDPGANIDVASGGSHVNNVQDKLHTQRSVSVDDAGFNGNVSSTGSSHVNNVQDTVHTQHSTVVTESGSNGNVSSGGQSSTSSISSPPSPPPTDIGQFPK